MCWNSNSTSNSATVQLAHELVERAQIHKRNSTLGNSSVSVMITRVAICELLNPQLYGANASDWDSHVAPWCRIAVNVNATATSGLIYPLSLSESWSQTFEFWSKFIGTLLRRDAVKFDDHHGGNGASMFL
jgi:hypothetical protein